MVEHQQNENDFEEEFPPDRGGFFGGLGKVYTGLRNVILRRGKVYFTEDEIHYLIDIVDVWIDAYPSVGADADDEEIPSLHHDMSTAMEVRTKLWRQLHE